MRDIVTHRLNKGKEIECIWIYGKRSKKLRLLQNQIGEDDKYKKKIQKNCPHPEEEKYYY